MAAAVSSRSRGAAGGLFFLFTLLGLVCTAASLMDENKLARRDTASEFNNGFMSLLDPTIAFMRKAAEGSPEYSAVTEEYLKSTKGFMEKFKSLMDGDNVKLDAKISKWEQDLRKKKIFVQAQEEQHAELNKFQQHNEYFYQQYGRHILRLYANQPDPPQSVDEANASGMRVSFQNFIQYLLDPLTERKEPLEPHWRQMQRLCQPCLIKCSPFTHITGEIRNLLFFIFTLLGLVCTAASLMDENKLARRDTASEIINGL
ncbi:Carbohydrate sulfotransferase 12 [Dissostichus eleginoides]|uniref:Carbohydrate sulfotransferase n=1 Tax=Dissostichus eleginoides TaxID=100907 RepID=A0AAD9F6I9_DISEL|nr:Carbohydrate sulfotransferase 12 [Dissostichus eleginoides]